MSQEIRPSIRGYRRMAETALLAVLLAGLSPVLAFGQAADMGPPGAAARPAPKVDPAFQAAEKAFLALDIKERKAIQNDLIWAAKFAGSPTGDFGPLTFAAIRRFEAESKLPATGALSPAVRERLRAQAEIQRKATGFVLQTDPKSGMKIGLPAFLRVKTAPNNLGASRWQDKDEKATVDLSVYKREDELQQLYERGIDPKVKGRKITYKLLRPDFFVITGETEGGKFYRRVEKSEKGDIRGFSIGYDKKVASAVDPFVVAIAATFDPFGKAGGAPASSPGTPVADAGPQKRRATGLVIAPDTILTSEGALKGCAEIALDLGNDGKFAPARIAKNLGVSGLMLVSAKTGKPLSIGITEGGEASGVVVQRDAVGELLASGAEIAAGKATVSLQPGGGGAALFNRNGALAGVIAVSPVEKFKVAGVIPSLSYAYLPAAEALRLVGVDVRPSEARTPQSAAAIAEAVREGVVSLVCASDK
ncbi:MAG TPA: peptidoglycan-binding domain-containing protein [Rhabdaerophilum sp.]|nr:peptidoglycan-binding domain-containing protein [Rhabdaerophilum sp.]